MRTVITLLLVLLVVILPYFMGRWCRYNTELLSSHYTGRVIKLPNFPFVLGAYFTQCSLPYGIVTEIWAGVVGVK